MADSGSRICNLKYKISAASSSTPDHKPKNVLSQNKDTYWSVGSGAHHELKLKLRAPALIGYVDIYNRHAGEVELYVSQTDSGKQSYIKVNSFSRIAHDKKRTFKLAFLPGRFVKLHFKKGNPTSIYSINLRGIPMSKAQEALGSGTFQLCVERLTESKCFSAQHGVRQDRIDKPCFPHDQFDAPPDVILSKKFFREVGGWPNEEEIEAANELVHDEKVNTQGAGIEIIEDYFGDNVEPSSESKYDLALSETNYISVDPASISSQSQQSKKITVTAEEALAYLSPLTSADPTSVPLNEVYSGFSQTTAKSRQINDSIFSLQADIIRAPSVKTAKTVSSKLSPKGTQRRYKKGDSKSPPKSSGKRSARSIQQQKVSQWVAADPVWKPRVRTKLNRMELHSKRPTSWRSIAPVDHRFGTFTYLRAGAASRRNK